MGKIVLGSILDLAVENRWLETNSVAKAKVPHNGTVQRRIYLTPQEIKIIAGQMDDINATIVYLLAYTGMRIGEALALRCGDVDLSRNRINILRAQSVDANYLMVETLPKGNRTRFVPIPNKLLPKVKTICEVTELSERTLRSALKLLESRGFIRPGDQRHAAIAKNGRTRPKQYRATVWNLCVDQDPEVLNYLTRTNHDDDKEPESNLCGQPQNQDKNKAQNWGAAAAPLYKPSGNNHRYPLVPSGHSPKAETSQPEALELVASLRALLEELDLPVPQ